MFDYGNANENQRKAIKAVDGPLLIIAGPGTGKTFTVVKRAAYLITEKGVPPEDIMIATFTEKAAKEIITRITDEMIGIGVVVNIHEMYIGTFHSICLRIIKENLEFTRIKKNYRMLDSFDQQYAIFQNIGMFRRIEEFNSLFDMGAWRQAKVIADFANNISEELVDYNDLYNDPDLAIKMIADILDTYNQVLVNNNLIDFSAIQIEAYNLITQNPAILKKLQEKLRYIMVDEYQDTNYVQEQIVFLLAGKDKNLCVVGDDDQGLYRFRGATIRNILEFPNKFDNHECVQIKLTENYRSDKKIIHYYNNWMKTTAGKDFKFKWDNYRFNKDIISGKDKHNEGATVIKVSGKDIDDDWHETILDFINCLKFSGKLTDLNQIAFLFRSITNEKVVALANFLERNGVNVYSPRSDMFFYRNEIKMMLGCIMLTFPVQLDKFNKREYEFVSAQLENYYNNCVTIASKFIQASENKELLNWIKIHGRAHATMTKNTNYGLSALMYQLLEFEPFRSYLGVDLNEGVINLRPARNLATLSGIITKYEYLHRIDVLTSKNIDKTVELFFNMYLKFLFDGGITEYEDDSEYAPSDCVSFLTIHQSKGMEFPIVVVRSLGNNPIQRNNNLMDEIEDKYFKRKAFEPKDSIKYFDFWRLYYTAFSRAQNLLVMTCCEKGGRGRQPSKYFEDVYKSLPSYKNSSFDLNEFNFETIKDLNLKSTYSFTSHIAVYENCALQYKFYKELGFIPIRVGATLFGMLVHQTIEDIHRTAIRREEHLITPDNIKLWVDTNYGAISKSERAYLGQSQLDAVLKQVIRYADGQSGHWDRIQATEVEVSLVKPEYILQGTIDLIRGENDTVEIVDFKSEKKPDIFADKEKLERYKRQLQIYAHLVEEKTGHVVSNMHLYYTGEENGVPTITFPKNKASIDATIAQFDNVVRKIKNKEFSEKSKSLILCDNCDMRFLCKK